MNVFKVVYRISFAKGENKAPEYHIAAFTPDNTLADVTKAGYERMAQYMEQGHKVRAVHLRLHTDTSDNWLRVREDIK